MNKPFEQVSEGVVMLSANFLWPDKTIKPDKKDVFHRDFATKQLNQILTLTINEAVAEVIVVPSGQNPKPPKSCFFQQK